jgi:transcriptional regulator with XRE-family HTH domain
MEQVNTVVDFLDKVGKPFGAESNILLLRGTVSVLFAAFFLFASWLLWRALVAALRKFRDWRVERSGGFAPYDKRKESAGFSEEFPVQVKLRGLSSQQLSDAAGISKIKIDYLIERPHKIPDRPTVERLCDVLDVPPDHFREGNDYGYRDYGRELTKKRILRYLNSPGQFDPAAVAALGRRFCGNHEINRDALNSFELVALMNCTGKGHHED